MENMKRNNWSNKEVLKLLERFRMTDEKPDWFSADEMDAYNEAIDDAKDMFFDFMRPLEEPGAMGYNAEEDMIYHVGTPLPRLPIE